LTVTKISADETYQDNCGMRLWKN